MKKQNLLKLALVSIAMMVFTGAWAQNPPAPYVEYDADTQVPTNIDYVTLRTGGTTTLGYYALPDANYHPNYVAAGTLTADFVWNWTIPTFPAGYVETIAKPGAANYAQITYDRIGDYVVNVAEQASAAYGGCADGTPTIMNVTVINPPSAGFTTADVLTGWCGDQVAQAINISITENVPDELAGYAFSVEEVVENIDINGNAIGAALTTNSTFVDFPTTGEVVDGDAGFTAATPDFDYDFNSSALVVENNLRTRYTYTLKKASDATAVDEGIISLISQKSDYIAGTQLAYAYTDDTVIFIVNPNPSTGPIYHIPNDYAL